MDEKLYDLWHDNGDAIWEVIGRELDEADLVVLAKLVEEAIGVDSVDILGSRVRRKKGAKATWISIKIERNTLRNDMKILLKV